MEKEKINRWLKENWVLVAILLFSLAVLLYFFFVTKNQPVWWDEAEYLSTAKHWAFNTFDYQNPQRPPLFSFLAFLIYSIGLREVAIKFLLVLVPTFLSVLFLYLLIKEMYNKRTALIASFILSVSWISLFYAMRFMTDALGFMAGILVFLFFWKGYYKKQGNHYLYLMGFFLGIALLSRLTGIFFGVVILIFLLFTERLKFLTNKHLWFALIVFLLTISPLLIFDFYQFHNPLAFRSGYGGPAGVGPGWSMINFVYDYPELIFFIMFIIGILTILPMFLGLDLLLIKQDKKYYPDFFMFLAILLTLIFFIFFIRQAENRWLILISIAIFTFSAKGILLIYDYLKKNSKSLAILVLLIIIAAGAYVQLNHANAIIVSKVNSYSEVRDAALWMKQNANPGDAVLSISYTQTIYYYEGPVYTFSGMNQSAFEELVKEVKPKYMIVSGFEPNHPDWSYNMPESYKQFLKPVNVWFADAAKTQPVLIIYEFTSYNF